MRVQIDQLVGQWVYDHSEEGVWETQKFLPSGVFYYWNKVSGGWKFQNTANGGRFWIEDNDRVTCQYSLNGISAQIKMTIKSISDYSYTAEYNDGATLGIFTYARLLDNLQLKPGESATPEYNILVKPSIQGLKSHNTSIALVDPTSGEITGVKSGHTYVDVMTDQGTAVIEVVVFDAENMFEDYSYAFGKTIPEIVELLGDDYDYIDDNNGLIYLSDDYLIDEIRFITGAYDKTHVEFVRLGLNNNVTSTSIINHLSTKYLSISNSDGVYNYVTDMSVDENPVAIIYDSNASTLSYTVILPASRWTDFSYLFGQSDNEVNKEMTAWGYPYLFSDYGYSKDGSDYYTINDSKDASFVGFVFNGEKKMCEYWVYLYEDFMKNANDILTWLKSKYTLSTAESTNSQYVLYDKTKRMRIVFDASGYVSYTDTEQTPFTPSTSSYSAMPPKGRTLQKKTSKVKKQNIIRVPELTRQ
ncbi:MAG: hypothetical protein NC131_09365 [Roseburia sp.]|nr:hypothetical protein [Roseburia sp.]